MTNCAHVHKACCHATDDRKNQCPAPVKEGLSHTWKCPTTDGTAWVVGAIAPEWPGQGGAVEGITTLAVRSEELTSKGPGYSGALGTFPVWQGLDMVLYLAWVLPMAMLSPPEPQRTAWKSLSCSSKSPWPHLQDSMQRLTAGLFLSSASNPGMEIMSPAGWAWVPL